MAGWCVCEQKGQYTVAASLSTIYIQRKKCDLNNFWVESIPPWLFGPPPLINTNLQQPFFTYFSTVLWVNDDPKGEAKTLWAALLFHNKRCWHTFSKWGYFIYDIGVKSLFPTKIHKIHHSSTKVHISVTLYGSCKSWFKFEICKQVKNWHWIIVRVKKGIQYNCMHGVLLLINIWLQPSTTCFHQWSNVVKTIQAYSEKEIFLTCPYYKKTWNFTVCDLYYRNICLEAAIIIHCLSDRSWKSSHTYERTLLPM